MFEGAFNKFYWGFFFVMIDFRFQGVDILPDIIGYFFFAAGLAALASANSCFEKAKSLNTFMIVLSILEIYEKPVQVSGINFGVFGPIGFIIGIAATILNLYVIYNLFMGIRNLAREQDKMLISEEAERRWTQYLMLQLSSLFIIILVVIPPLAVIALIALFIFLIILTVIILGFMKRCGISL
jgi:hypothetical protein